MKPRPALILVLSVLAACASDPNGRVSSLRGSGPDDGTRPTCIAPPADSASADLETTVEAMIPRVREVMGASLPPGEKVERILGEIPDPQALELLAFRVCMADRGNGADPAGSGESLSQILPMLRTAANPAYFAAREQAEAYALGYTVGSIHRYHGENSRYPASLSDLSAQSHIETLGPRRVEYRVDADRGFVLRFAGRDRRLGTDDDQVHDGGSM